MQNFVSISFVCVVLVFAVLTSLLLLAVGSETAELTDDTKFPVAITIMDFSSIKMVCKSTILYTVSLQLEFPDWSSLKVPLKEEFQTLRDISSDVLQRTTILSEYTLIDIKDDVLGHLHMPPRQLFCIAGPVRKSLTEHPESLNETHIIEELLDNSVFLRYLRGKSLADVSILKNIQTNSEVFGCGWWGTGSFILKFAQILYRFHSPCQDDFCKASRKFQTIPLK